MNNESKQSDCVIEADTTRSTQEKIALYQQLFHGLQNVYGSYDLTTNRVRVVKAPVNERVTIIWSSPVHTKDT